MAQPKRAPAPIVRDHRPAADLDVTQLNTADNLALVGIVNRGGNGMNKARTMRIQMFQTVNRREVLVATVYTAVPLIPSGTHKVVTVTFPRAVKGHRLVGQLDVHNQIPEANESNNRFMRIIR